MKNLSSNRKIINILENLKDKEPNYPPELMQARREMFARQALSIALAVNTANNGINTGDHTPPSIGTLIETLLIAAIAVEAGTATHVYRGKLADVWNSVFPPRVENVKDTSDSPSSPSVIIPYIGEQPGTSTSISPIFTDSPMPSTIAISTPSPINVESNDGEEVDKIIPTPKPKDNNGNHYGQTPKPEWTKENKPKNKETKEPNDKPPQSLKNK
jgi:hypothetical protein